MMVDEAVLDYVADRTLGDFNQGCLDDGVAGSLARRPWIDAIRRRADASHVERVRALIESPDDHPGLTSLALNIARGLDGQELSCSVWAAFQKANNLSIKVSAMLLLAAYGEMGGKWDSALAAIGQDKEKLLRTAMAFYGCDSEHELSQSVRERLSSQDYTFNRPYYDFILQVIGETR